MHRLTHLQRGISICRSRDSGTWNEGWKCWSISTGRQRRKYRRWKRLGIGLLGCGLTVALAGAADQKPGTVEAREFVLRDDNGVMRASLTIRSDGTPGFGLFDKNGKVRLSFDLDAEGKAGLNLHDGEGILRAAVAMRRTARRGSDCSGPRARCGHRSTSAATARRASTSSTTPGRSARRWRCDRTPRRPSACSTRRAACNARSRPATTRSRPVTRVRSDRPAEGDHGEPGSQGLARGTGRPVPYSW